MLERLWRMLVVGDVGPMGVVEPFFGVGTMTWCFDDNWVSVDFLV